MSYQQAADDVTERFEADFAKYQEEHAKLIVQLNAEVGDVVVDEVAVELIDDLCGHLGAEAANACEHAADQDAALTAAENFVHEQFTQNQTNLITLALWLKGSRDGAEFVREKFQITAPAPGV